MDWTFVSLVPFAVSIVLLYVAFRAQERFWTLGFLGWKKVYSGLALYFVSGLLSGIWFWVVNASPGAAALPYLQVGILLFGAAGVAVVLAGSIERLRELSNERARLEDIRAGFDLFDSLREIIGQPYAFLEVLDYALKEMVRAAGVTSGGLWLYNPGKSEWILTGWANMSETLRQQTESMRGSGTGFDRLAAAHKARLFSDPEKIRAFFPEWEAEGFHSILGLPLTSGAVGSSGRQLLGAIILADESPARFDDDRARRLYAASDYVAAVIAEARITRQLDGARQQLDAAYAELAREREEARKQKADDAARLEDTQKGHEDRMKAAQEAHAARILEEKAKATEELNQLKIKLEKQLTVETERAEQMRQRWEEVRRSSEQLEQRVADERAGWEKRLDELHREWQEEREAARAHERKLTEEHHEFVVASERKNSDLEHQLINGRLEHAAVNEDLDRTMKILAQRDTELDKAGQVRLRIERELEDNRAQLDGERRVSADHQLALDDARKMIADREKTLAAEKERHAGETAVHQEALTQARATIDEISANLAGERERRSAESTTHNAVLADLQARLSTIEDQLTTEQERATALSEDLLSQTSALEQLESRIQTERRESAESVAEYTERLESLRKSAAEEREAYEEERRTLRRQLEDRHAQIAAFQQAEEHARAETERLQNAVESQRQAASEALAAAEDRLQEAHAQRVSLERDLESLRAEWAELDERHQREQVEERLAHRRHIHSIESRDAETHERLRRVLALPDSSERLSSLMGHLQDQLPEAEIYLWQRIGGSSPRMMAWADMDAIVHTGEDLPPWLFELHTIPAEGVTRLIKPELWSHARDQQDGEDRDAWSDHWGLEHEPAWAVCLPWSAGPGAINGWVTAFGFGDTPATEEEVDRAETWTAFLAAAINGLESVPVITPPEQTSLLDEEEDDDEEDTDEPVADYSDPDTNDPDDGIDADDEDEALDELESIEAALRAADLTGAAFADEVESEYSDELDTADDDELTHTDAMSARSEGIVDSDEDDDDTIATTGTRKEEDAPDLHHAIIDWAANQTDDALRLDLNARPPQYGIDEEWLRKTLEQVRRSCRVGNGSHEEFTVSTMRENGHTVLRMFRGQLQSGIVAVEDGDLAGQSTAQGDEDKIATPSPVTGRWLLHDGTRVGMELLFVAERREEAPKAKESPKPVSSPDDTEKRAGILILDDQEEMGDLLTDMLGSLGYAAEYAEDYEDAQRQIAGGTIEGVVIDTTMTSDAGWEMARRLTESDSRPPVLLIIGAETTSVPDDVAGDWWLRMPFRIEELQEAIEAIRMLAPSSHAGTEIT